MKVTLEVANPYDYNQFFHLRHGPHEAAYVPFDFVITFVTTLWIVT